MSAETFVGRGNAIDQLHAVLNSEVTRGGRLTILSIEGAGGVGKTSLLDHVLLGHDFMHRNYLSLRVDGSHGTAEAGLFAGVCRLVDSARAKAVQAKPPGHYFPAVKKAVQTLEA